MSWESIIISLLIGLGATIVTSMSLFLSQEAKAIINPKRGFDVGAGPGHKLERLVMGGIVGIVLDARGRPLQLPEDDYERRATLVKWFTALSLYPETVLKRLQDNLSERTVP